ncbi:MAG: sigma-70 family RNA polymerase sigma factor [Candidatus Omnitrophica bacterium]|nr:sigma-70 family RNA polymerase sigma factor [Candidatus Omnitrophota bacterium]
MDDLEFVQRCVKGDSLAWDEFVERYSRLIYSYIYQVLGSRHPGLSYEDHAADIFQEIFLLLTKDNYYKLKSFKAKNGCSLASWLRQITVNYSIDYLRREKKTFSLEEERENGFSLKDILADTGLSAGDQVSQEEILANLAGCVEELGTEEKFFLEMHLERALSAEELSRFFKVRRGAIDMRKWRIIESLKDCFRRKGFL